MKNQLVLIVLMSLVIQAFGQKSQTIEINPFGDDNIPDKLKMGTTVKCKISNVNTFLLSGSLSSTSTKIDFEIPEVFSQSSTSEEAVTPVEEFTEEFTEEMKVLLHITMTDKEEQNFLAELNKNLQNDLKIQFLDALSRFNKAYSHVHQYMELEDLLLEQIEDSIFIRNIDVIKNNARGNYQSVYGIIEKDDPKHGEARMQIEKSLDSLINYYSILNQLFNELNKTLENETVIIKGAFVYKKEDTDTTGMVIHQERRKYFADEMAYVEKIYKIVSDPDKKFQMVRKVHAGINLYERIEQETFVAYTVSEQLNDDIVTITPKLKYANGQIAQEFCPIQLRTRCGWKVNFSSGYMLSFVGNDNYTLFRDSAGTAMGAIETNSSKITHAVGGLIHAYPRWANPSIPNTALSAGFSMSAGGNIGFYGGVSVMLLEENRLVISTGYSAVSVKRLNTANLVDSGENQYAFRGSSDSTINYDDVYKGAWFIGLSYNLSK